MRKWRQREIHVMELETELLHLRLQPSASSSDQLHLENNSKNRRTETKKIAIVPSIFSINDLREYNPQPRLRPLIQDEKSHLPNIDRFLTLDDSSSDDEMGNEREKNDEYVSRMLFIPLRGENQISLSQTSTESESQMESMKSGEVLISTFELKRKRPMRQALGVITNRQRGESASRMEEI
jgi:hypothetical protein